MTTASASQPMENGQDAAQDLGHELEALLDHLARSGLKIGPRERVATAALVASVTASGAVRSLADLAPMLAPLLARSPDERRSFHQILAAYAPEAALPPEPEPPPLVAAPVRVAWRGWPMVGLAVVAICVAVAIALWPTPEVQVAQEAKPVEAASGRLAPQPVQETAPEAAPSDNELIDRIVNAAERFEGAPTLDELAPSLSLTSKIGWPPESIAVRLRELTGLPHDAPLALFADNGTVLARLAHALDRIERPGREAKIAALTAAVTKFISERKPGQVYEVAAALPQWLNGDVPRDKPGMIDFIRKRAHEARAGADAPWSAADNIDEQTVQRALAIASDAKVRRVFDDAPWLDSDNANAERASWWVRAIAALVPLLLAVLWLANSLALRKAYLRRRPPAFPPLHVDLVAEAATRATYPVALFRRIAQRLQRRTARPTTEIDAAATIAATVRGGGEIMVPVFAATRHAPEYLVLIERRAAGDQDAARLRDLVSRLGELVPFAVYYYQREPSMLEPERGGRSVPIEQLQARFADHRLLILGAGSGLLEPVTLTAHAAAAKLRHWPERALLTPLPIAEWGREEFALASELDMPVGRATPEGLLALAEALGQNLDEREELIVTRGDGLARPLPKFLRVRPQRFLYNTPPGDLPESTIIQHLRNFLDAAGFEWLAALAVYPAVQWDLTLYLGVTLPERSGTDANAARLYREDRVAALTQLPWLREGHMPDWLRRSLIATLSPARANEIRAALQRLIHAAELSGDRMRDEAVKLRIAQEPPKDRLPENELLDDEVLVDFLARGRIEDFALPRNRLLERLLPRGWLDRIGIPELSAGLVALVYAVAAWWLSPKPADGALLTGAWLPLLVLALGGLFALAIAEPRTTYQVLRRWLILLGPFALAFAILAPMLGDDVILADLQRFGPQVSLPLLGEFVAVVLALAALAIGKRIGRPLLRIAMPPRRPFHVRAGLALVASLALLVIAYVAVSYLGSDSAALPSAAFGPGWRVIALGLGVFGLAFLAERLMPVRLPPPRAAPREGRRAWSVSGGVAKAALSVLPILAAVWLAHMVATSSQMLQPMPGGIAAVAETPDQAFIALGGADGRVRVYARKDGRLETKPRIVEPKEATGAITSLALRFEADDTSKPLILAVGSADGAVRLYDGKGGSQRPLPERLANLRSVAAPPLVALLPGGVLVAAVEGEDGNGVIVTANGSLALADSGPVTSLVAAGPGALAVATNDGRVRFVKDDAAYGPRIADGSDLAPRLPGRARKLMFDTAARRISAIGDDGSVLTARIENGALADVALSEVKLTAMALGPAVAFRREAPARTAKHVALVIGNSNYQREADLANPVRDAEAVGEALRSLGFDVQTVLNADRKVMNSAITRFWDSSRGASVALLFYAGRTFASGELNYLAPVDIDYSTQDQAVRTAISVEGLLQSSGLARDLNICLIDAGEGSQLFGAPSASTAAKGLGEQSPRLPETTIVGYSAGGGTEALDGPGTSSPYSKALVSGLANPDRDIRDLLQEVNRRVVVETQGKQTPVVYVNLSPEPITVLGTKPTAAREEFSTVRVYYGTDRADAVVSPRGSSADQPPEQRTAEPPLAKSLKSKASPRTPGPSAPRAPGRPSETGDGAGRLQYGSERGRRLALGTVDVTVPLDHQISPERPWAIKIPYFDVKVYEEKEDPRKHFTISKIDRLPPDALAKSARERAQSAQRFAGQALLFIHGYNTSFDNAVYRAAQIAFDIKFDGPVFVYSWPSGGGIASYTYDRESSSQSEPYLRQFLDEVLKTVDPGQLSIIAHSMGAQPLLRALSDMKRSSGDSALIRALILASPDSDRDSFENIMIGLRGVARSTTLYVSGNDRALQSSRRFNGGVPRAGDVPESGALVLPGVDTIDVTATSTDVLILQHSGYAEDNTLLNDIGTLIQTGAPPDKRTPGLEKVETAKGVYWRYPTLK